MCERLYVDRAAGLTRATVAECGGRILRLAGDSEPALARSRLCLVIGVRLRDE